jgi:hypothetical protein
MSFRMPDLEEIAGAKGWDVYKRSVQYGTIKTTTLHVYEHAPNMMTYCGLEVNILERNQKDHFASAQDIFGPRPLWGDEVMCPDCAATARYEEQLAWYTLGELP